MPNVQPIICRACSHCSPVGHLGLTDNAIFLLYSFNSFCYRLAMINTVDSIDRLRLVINTLTAEEADPASIVAAHNINKPRFFQQLSSTRK